MQSVAYSHNKPRVAAAVKSQNQFKPQRRDSIQHRAILAAVREWESTLPGQAQERIAQLVAEEVIGAHDAEQAEEEEYREIAQAAIAIGAPSDRVGNGRQQRQGTETDEGEQR